MNHEQKAVDPNCDNLLSKWYDRGRDQCFCQPDSVILLIGNFHLALFSVLEGFLKPSS